MKGKSVGLTILLWGEVIIALRVLLFTIPVAINNILAEDFILGDADNRYIILLTLTAVFYFLAGLTSIVGFRFWKFLHVSAAVFTLLCTLGSLNGQGQAGTGSHYFYPIIFGGIITVIAIMLGREKTPA